MPVLPVQGSLQAVIVWKALTLGTASRLWKVIDCPGSTVGTLRPALGSAWQVNDWIPIVLPGTGALGNESGFAAPVASPPWLSFSARCPWVRTSSCGMHPGGLAGGTQFSACASSPPTSVPL